MLPNQTAATATSILALAKAKPEVLAVEAPGLGTVHLAPMRAGARDAWEAQYSASRKAGLPNLRGSLLAAMLCSPEGVPLFDARDGEKLADLPAETIEPVFESALRLAGLTEGDADELAKKSETPPDAA